jgi:phosphoribosylformylglycinamidine synthase
VLEAARNVACSGARPLALVNCLNFGNPEHPEVMWQFVEVVEGMSEACEALGIPVIGGNVSFYNASSGADIHPTPVVGVLGLIDELAGPLPSARLAAGESIIVLGDTRPELGGSEWAAVVHGLDGGAPPIADLDAAVRLHGLVSDLVREREVEGVHDVSDGGLAVALCEMAFAGSTGFRVDLATAPGARDGSPAEAAFGESTSRVVASVASEQVAAVLGAAAAAGVAAAVIGNAGGDQCIADGAFAVPLAEARRAWQEAIPNLMAKS